MAVGHVVVEADGGSRGNPGPAGYGAVVYDPTTGEVLAEAKDGIGTATNNVAEYRGLIAGLTAARDLGATSVAVRMDSKLVIEQMKGTWAVKNEGLRPLAAQAQQLRRGFEAISFQWIPREQNKHADRLANEAMDAAAGIAPKKTRATAASAVSATAAAASAAAAPSPTLGSWGPPSARSLRLVLVRHGATAHSAERRFSGRNDLPLDPHGQAQAAALAQRGYGPVTTLIASPLPRTMQTAEVLGAALRLPVHPEPDLVETDFGAWEGRTSAEVHAQTPDALADWHASLDVAPPGGESFSAVLVRVQRALERLQTRYRGQTVVVVSHVTPIKLLLGLALRDVEAALFRLHLDTASVSVADFGQDGRASVRLVNDTSHLPAGPVA